MSAVAAVRRVDVEIAAFLQADLIASVMGPLRPFAAKSSRTHNELKSENESRKQAMACFIPQQ
jgi:hypothetical protein